MTALVFDSAAISILARESGAGFEAIRGAMASAATLNRPIVVPAVILAEVYRGPHHNSLVDACLSRESAMEVLDTDRSLARLVGGVLAAAGAGSEDLADAHCVAATIDAAGGVILTGDEDDLERLSASYPNVTVVGI